MINFIHEFVILYRCTEGTYYPMRSPPRNVPFFHSLAKSFIKWYERLWCLCISRKIKRMIIKFMIGSLSTICFLLDEYWVYEKYSHLCVIFWFFHSNSNHCCVFLSSFYHQDIFTTQNESSGKWHWIWILFDVRWMWSSASVHPKSHISRFSHYSIWAIVYFIINIIQWLKVIELIEYIYLCHRSVAKYQWLRVEEFEHATFSGKLKIDSCERLYHWCTNHQIGIKLI